MFELTYLKFRTQYYFNETRELIARHKLLTAFIICLLAPGVKNIQAIGILFYALIDPLTTFKIKFVYLTSLLSFLLAMTNAQLSFIKGGAFRAYLHTVHISSRVHKGVDFIILLFSLNIVWLAIFFGGASIFHDAKAPLYLSSQYLLYVSLIFVLCTLLLTLLYKKIASGVLSFSALLLVVFISSQGNWLLNYCVGTGILLTCGITVWLIEPCQNKKKHSFKIMHFEQFNKLDSLKNIFIIQLAVLRKHKLSFLIRFTLCFFLYPLILQVLASPETVNNRQELIIVLIGLQTYILSTLFAFFEKEKLEHNLFHKIFPYQSHTKIIKEIILITTGFLLTLSPVFVFLIVNLKNGFSLTFIIVATNCTVLAINRVLYRQSLRFCLFTSLLNTLCGCVIQYIFSGA